LTVSKEIAWGSTSGTAALGLAPPGVHAAIHLEAIEALILSADRDASERPRGSEGTERDGNAQVPSQVRQDGQLRFGDEMRRSGAAGVDQRIHARAHGHVRQLDDTRLEHEIGAVALAEP